MIDNIGSHTASFINSEISSSGIVSLGGEAEIVIEDVDPIEITDHILGNDSDYIALSYSGKMPVIKQEAYDGDVVTHSMIEISTANKICSLVLNPSPNSDLAVINGKCPYPGDEMRDEARIIFSTVVETRFDQERRESVTETRVYLIFEGVGFLLGISEFEGTVLGTARVRTRIIFDENTSVSNFVFGQKKLNFERVEEMNKMRDEDTTDTAISAEQEGILKRNTVKGFNSKTSKLYDVNGGL